MFHLANPYWLFGLLVIPALVWWHRRRKPASMKFPFTSLVPFSSLESPKTRLYKISHWLEFAVIGLIIIGLARPQLGRSYEEVITKGIDIVVVLDISSSMLTIDFPESYSIDKIRDVLSRGKLGRLPPNRITLAKKSARDFIEHRKNDRIGLVVFSKEAFTQCPPTLDYNILLQLLEDVDIGLIEDGTAIGMGIAIALNRLKESTAKSKIIVLLTDGQNNAGKIDPLTAAELARSIGVKIYTIGTGNRGISIYPVQTPFGLRYAQVSGQELNESELQKIADVTGGLYFLAETPGALTRIFNTIDKLEKVEIKSRRYTLYKEIYKYFVLLGFALLVICTILSFTYICKIP